MNSKNDEMNYFFSCLKNANNQNLKQGSKSKKWQAKFSHELVFLFGTLLRESKPVITRSLCLNVQMKHWSAVFFEVFETQVFSARVNEIDSPEVFHQILESFLLRPLATNVYCCC